MKRNFEGVGGRSRVKANWRARFLNVSLIITTLETIHSIEVRCIRVQNTAFFKLSWCFYLGVFIHCSLITFRTCLLCVINGGYLFNYIYYLIALFWLRVCGWWRERAYVKCLSDDSYYLLSLLKLVQLLQMLSSLDFVSLALHAKIGTPSYPSSYNAS